MTDITVTCAYTEDFHNDWAVHLVFTGLPSEEVAQDLSAWLREMLQARTLAIGDVVGRPVRVN